MAELIKMPFGLLSWVDPRNRVSDGGPHPCMGRDSFEGEKRWPIVKYIDTLVGAVQKGLNRLRCCLARGLESCNEACIRWGPDHHTSRGNCESEKGLTQDSPEMSSSRYTQSDSAGGSTGTVWMPIGCMGCTLAPPGKYD